ncbi:hypothetical protein [Flavobacterium agrisoli]|uniref:Uncharacterized protein n=1 Tax=Flavobacterium agrisoli TaxID=2793066 RepID=A0A934UKD1_9FLAO|nr:hypothetical protein [Flavobacterium agrisoli]MBK0370424.1 hypothetical protein [Flavobacterium agrisoli]
MIIHYKGSQFGQSTTFTLKIIGNNLSRSSSNYQVELYVGDKKLPTKTSEIHQSLSNCLKEIYLFRKYNGIQFDASSETIEPKLVPYDLVLFNFQKHALFRA